MAAGAQDASEVKYDHQDDDPHDDRAEQQRGSTSVGWLGLLVMVWIAPHWGSSLVLESFLPQRLRRDDGRRNSD